MRIGLHLPQLGRAASPENLVFVAQRAEALGFSDAWVSDHVAVPVTMSGTPSFFPEPVPLLSMVAGHTDRIGLGTSVIIGAYRNPMHFAKQWATLDWLAPGRTVLGLGAGWLDEEFEACGVDPANKGRRLDDYIAGWRALWSGETEYTGEYFSFQGVRVRPEPVEPIKVWIGGSSSGAIKRAAGNDGWHPTWAPVDVMAQRLEILHAEIDRLGRDRDQVTVSMHMEMRLGEQLPVGYWSREGDGYGEREVADATREGLVATLRRYEHIGVQHIVLTPQCRSLEEWTEQLDALEGLPEEMERA
ncbi:MAG: TIGR03619 family F420-dependent LLM class oxidoreductase [Nostocoides sp.]